MPSLEHADLRAAIERARPNPEHDDAHDLMPAWLRPLMPRLYSTEHQPDPLVMVKLFTPDSSWTWWLTEYNPDQNIAFGLVQGFETELGYVSLDELYPVRGPFGLQIERDLWFPPTPLSEVQKQFEERQS